MLIDFFYIQDSLLAFFHFLITLDSGFVHVQDLAVQPHLMNPVINEDQPFLAAANDPISHAFSWQHQSHPIAVLLLAGKWQPLCKLLIHDLGYKSGGCHGMR